MQEVRLCVTFMSKAITTMANNAIQWSIIVVKKDALCPLAFAAYVNLAGLLTHDGSQSTVGMTPSLLNANALQNVIVCAY